MRCLSSVVNLVDALTYGGGDAVKGMSSRMHCFCRDGFAFVAGGGDLMHVRDGAVHAEKMLQHRTPVVCVAADGDWVSVAARGGTMALSRTAFPEIPKRMNFQGRQRLPGLQRPTSFRAMKQIEPQPPSDSQIMDDFWSLSEAQAIQT
jgi:hypothetical protein